MSESEPERRVRPVAGSFRPAAKPPRSFLSATADELAVLDARFREHLRAISQCQELFVGYLEGRATSQEWEDARRSADRARSAYERKCDAILVRTFRI